MLNTKMILQISIAQLKALVWQFLMDISHTENPALYSSHPSMTCSCPIPWAGRVAPFFIRTASLQRRASILPATTRDSPCGATSRIQTKGNEETPADEPTAAPRLSGNGGERSPQTSNPSQPHTFPDLFDCYLARFVVIFNSLRHKRIYI